MIRQGYFAVAVSICFALQASSHAATEITQATNTAQTASRDLTGFEALQERQPLWELGVGGGAIEVPDYPSSGERNFVALAAPYVIYRGDVFRLGDGGARAVVIEDKDFELDVSFGGAFAAESDDNTARENMPELDFLFEIGPQLIYRIRDYHFNNGGDARLNFKAQARAVFSTDFARIDDRGFVFEPQLSYQQRGALFEQTALNLSLSLVFATEALHDYFYQVDAPFVTPERSLYDAQGGFLGGELSVGFSFPVRKNIRGFVGGSVNFHHGSANLQSPLFEKKFTYDVAIGFVWRLYESERRANW